MWKRKKTHKHKHSDQKMKRIQTFYNIKHFISDASSDRLASCPGTSVIFNIWLQSIQFQTALKKQLILCNGAAIICVEPL